MNIELSVKEIELLGTFDGVITNCKRNSDKEFDLDITGFNKKGFSYSAWVPLKYIGEQNWCSQKIANMSDLPEMVLYGDWSGIRDSSMEAKWEIFETLMKENA